MHVVDQARTLAEGATARRASPIAAFGQRLRQARLACNMTQTELANGQFSVSYISAVERGQIRPSLGALEKLAARLHVAVHDLLRTDNGAGVEPRAEFHAGSAREDIELQLRDAQILMRQGMPREALNLLERLRGRGLAPRDQALVGWQIARCALELNDGEQARQEAQEAQALAERLKEPELRERIRLSLSEALSISGQQQSALAELRIAHEATENGSVRDPLFRLRVLYLLGDTYVQLGDLGSAIATLSEAATLANEALVPERLAHLYSQLAEQYRAAGDERRARLYAAHSLATYEEASNQRLARQALTRLGRVYAQVGRLGDAKTLLEAARERAERQQDSRALAEALTALSGIYLREQQIDDAARAAEQAMELAASAPDQIQEAEAQLALARVLEARNDEGATRHFEQAIERLKASDAIYPLSDAYAELSAYLERRGHNKRALELLKHAWQLRERTAAGR